MKSNKLDLFKKLGNYNNETHMTRIVDTDEFNTNEYKSLILGNGGSWCRRNISNYYKIATMKKNGIINILWDFSYIEEELIKNEFNKYIKSKGTKIKYIKIYGLNNNILYKNIRNDIKKYYLNKPWCACGSKSFLICDHKNDLYPILDLKLQNLDDFQSLCNSCNLRKREILKKTKETNKRYGATNIPCLEIYGIDFIEGDESFDINNINIMKGTYWYDPINFHNYIKKYFYNK